MNASAIPKLPLLPVFIAVAAIAGCHGAGPPSGGTSTIPQTDARHAAVPARVGLGKVLSAKDGGQIYGFDIDRSGSDGVLASATSSSRPKVSVQTFDEDSGRIVSLVKVDTADGSSYGADGIFNSDTALLTHYVIPKGGIYAKRFYQVMDPVTGNSITGKWTPPIEDVDVQQAGVNQSTPQSVLFAIELRNQDAPDLFVTDIAANTFGKVIHLDPNLFGLADAPQLAQFISKNEAVMALSPDGGAAGGKPPLNFLFDLQTGKSTQFGGYNNGPFHAGDVNGAAVDPNTGIEATDTELNAQVEFYDDNKKLGVIAVQLPCTNDADQLNSGSGIAVDPVHKLFLVTEEYYACGSGSAIAVYDETGALKETITGFSFYVGEPAPVLNPSKRMGWVFGPKVSQLQQFFY